MQTAVAEVFKAVTSRYTAPDLISKRSEVSIAINQVLQNKIGLYGASVINIDMRNFAFSASYMAAINDKVTQEQLRLAAENKLRTVEAEQKQKVAIAEADANAVKAKADGDAYAQLKVATAQAEALRVQNSALAQNGMFSNCAASRLIWRVPRSGTANCRRTSMPVRLSLSWV